MTDEAQIRSLLDDLVAALAAKDIDRIMSLNTPDVVVFDIPAPLQVVGNQAYRKNIVAWLDSHRGPVTFETRDLSIAVSEDLAFTHSLFRVSGTLRSGQQIDHWVRLTFCLRKVGDEWLIAHEHVSLPIDLQADTAVHIGSLTTVHQPRRRGDQ
jgi:uncharacterized protein (TIGR02246 family)